MFTNRLTFLRNRFYLFYTIVTKVKAQLSNENSAFSFIISSDIHTYKPTLNTRNTHDMKFKGKYYRKNRAFQELLNENIGKCSMKR